MAGDPLLSLARLHVEPGQSVREVLREVGAIAAASVGIDRFAIWLMTEDRSAIRVYFLSLPNGDEVVDGPILRAEDIPSYFAALREQRTVVVEDVGRHDAVRELRRAYCEPLGIGAMLDAPLYRGGSLVGVICFEHLGGPRAWTAAERELASSVAMVVTRLFEEGARMQVEDSLKAYQAQMGELSRLEGMGRLASGVAHDLRNLLTVVAGHVDLIALRAGDDGEIMESIGALREAVERSKALSDEVLRFGRARLDMPQVIDPVHMVRDLSRLLQSTLGADRPLRLLTPVKMSKVFADRAELERAILNLVVNARDATPEGGEVQISVFEACDDHGLANQVAIAVTDEGVGMDPTTLARVREPFFTTKTKGTGLGLAITQQIVARAGGTFSIASEVGHGTTASIVLPRIE